MAGAVDLLNTVASTGVLTTGDLESSGSCSM